ncbi:MAG: hypothetical protein V3V13_03420 [Paracoccaceae bacterium]
MWFGKFLFKSLMLSLPVALFWLPVLGITAYGVSTVYALLEDEFIGQMMLLVLFVLPVLTLLTVLAIRGGMTVLNVTDGSDIAKIMGVTTRVLLFHVPFIVIIIVLFGVSSTITGFKFMDNGYAEEFSRIAGLRSKFQSFFIKDIMMKFPIILFSGWIFGYCIAFAGMGVSMAGASAMAVAKPPNHHQIWGLGAQFGNLFGVALVVFFVPFVLGIFALGGLNAELKAILDLGVYKYGVAVYFLWALCAMYASAAIAYGMTLETEDARHTAELEAMAGLHADRPKVDLAALRKERMKK